jgi:hypothetical protein
MSGFLLLLIVTIHYELYAHLVAALCSPISALLFLFSSFSYIFPFRLSDSVVGDIMSSTKRELGMNTKKKGGAVG